MEAIVIDGKNATLGRLASYSAKRALLGREVVIVNANEIIITGRKKDILEKYKSLIKKGGSSLKGPKIVRTPERMMKRTIRGMLSHKQTRGNDALKRIRCYNEVPEEYKDVKKIKAGKEKMTKLMTLKELCVLLK